MPGNVDPTSNNSRFIADLGDGLAVETVYYGSGTLCLSSQAGCGVGCSFCASGAGGLRRNLTVGELQGQVELAQSRGWAPRRLTLSGIGEPLHNWPVVKEFLLGSELPVALTTTGGLLSHLAEALTLPHNGLMLSLHAGSPELHRRLVPGAPPLEALFRCVDQGLRNLSRRARRRFGLNYLLLAGINDGQKELELLAGHLRRWPETTLHLLACNPVAGSPYRSPPEGEFERIFGWLSRRHRHVRRPNRWRRQLIGGCGTLVLHRVGSGAAGPGFAPVRETP